MESGGGGVHLSPPPSPSCSLMVLCQVRKTVSIHEIESTLNLEYEVYSANDSIIKHIPNQKRSVRGIYVFILVVSTPNPKPHKRSCRRRNLQKYYARSPMPFTSYAFCWNVHKIYAKESSSEYLALYFVCLSVCWADQLRGRNT